MYPHTGVLTAARGAKIGKIYPAEYNVLKSYYYFPKCYIKLHSEMNVIDYESVRMAISKK